MDIKINKYPLLEIIVDDTVLHIPLETVIPFLKFSVASELSCSYAQRNNFTKR